MNPKASAFPAGSLMRLLQGRGDCGVSERAIRDNFISLRIEGFPADVQRGAFNYRMLMNFAMLLFVLLTLQCNNAVSPDNQIILNKDTGIIGTWFGTRHPDGVIIGLRIRDTSNHVDTLYDTVYDTIFEYKTYSITYDTIQISTRSTFRHPCPYPGCSTPTLTGKWSIDDDSLFVYPFPNSSLIYSTRYLVTKHLPDSLIFSSSLGIDTCVKQ